MDVMVAQSAGFCYGVKRAVELAAKTGDKVQVLIETVGTKDWSKRLGIASDHTQR